VCGGVGLCVASWVVTSTAILHSEWWSDLLLGLGVSCLLFLLLFILEELIRKLIMERDRLQAIREIESRTTAEASRSQTEADLRREMADLRRRLDELGAADTARSAEVLQTVASEGGVAEPQSQSAAQIADLIELAQGRGDITREGPRVTLRGSTNHVRFVVFRRELGFGRLWLQIEDDDGTYIADECWTEGTDWTTVRRWLQDTLGARDDSTRVDEDAVERVMELVSLARRRPKMAAPAIELFGDGVLLTEDEVVLRGQAKPTGYTWEEFRSPVPDELPSSPPPGLVDAIRVVGKMQTPWLEPQFH
jgi:hypothetical protein